MKTPEISPWLRRWFGRYATSYLGRHFHAVRLLAAAPWPEASAGPLVISLNHAGWWDPLVCLFLADKFFPQRPAYGPMEASALARYGFFRRLGFFPVEIGTTRGAAQFLRTSEAILARPESVLFLTPQGKFADVRAPLVLAPSLQHLRARAPQARFVALAVEYTFWEERKPEILLTFGDDLTAAQAQLAAAAQRREPNEWEILLRAGSSVNGFYDLWRRMRARWRGEKFTREHSRL